MGKLYFLIYTNTSRLYIIILISVCDNQALLKKIDLLFTVYTGIYKTNKRGTILGCT